MRRSFWTYCDFKKTAKKLQFCRIFRFSKKRARKVNFVYDFKLMYKMNEDSYAFNFFSQWKLKVHTFQRKRAFCVSMRSVRVIREKCAFDFHKNCNFLKNRKNAHKMRIFYFSALATSEMEKAHFFLPGTNRVCCKCAFWLLKTEIYKMKRCLLEWMFDARTDAIHGSK